MHSIGEVNYHGNGPFRVAVIHGGPGAPGSVAGLAKALSSRYGVLEPMQSAPSLEGQVEELRAQLTAGAVLPVTLIGWSWGAWLSLIYASRYPDEVSKLILIGCGPFRAKVAEGIMDTRMRRLNKAEQQEAHQLMRQLADPATPDKDQKLARFGSLFSKTDHYDPLPLENDPVMCQGDIFERVWADAAAFRKEGHLLETIAKIQCRVVAIHGDYDPHPAEGVQEPLAERLNDFIFFLLQECGHEPWNERHAREEFFEILEKELP